MFEIRTIYALTLAHMVLVLTLVVLFSYFWQLEALAAVVCVLCGLFYGGIMGGFARDTAAGEY